jgi:hypothetical protein
MASRKTRSMSLLITGLLLVVGATGIVNAVERIVGGARGEYRLSFPTSGFVSVKELAPGFEVAGATPILAIVDDPSFSQLLLASLPPALWWAGVVAILWLLRGLAVSVRDGDPFRTSNIRRLRGLGFLFLLGYPLATVIDGFMTNLFFSTPIWEEGRPFPAIIIEFQVFSATALLAGVGLLVLAEVFAHGVRLREDVDATV